MLTPHGGHLSGRSDAGAWRTVRLDAIRNDPLNNIARLSRTRFSQHMDVTRATRDAHPLLHINCKLHLGVLTRAFKNWLRWGVIIPAWLAKHYRRARLSGAGASGKSYGKS